MKAHLYRTFNAAKAQHPEKIVKLSAFYGISPLCVKKLARFLPQTICQCWRSANHGMDLRERFTHCDDAALRGCAAASLAQPLETTFTGGTARLTLSRGGIAPPDAARWAATPSKLRSYQIRQTFQRIADTADRLAALDRLRLQRLHPGRNGADLGGAV